MGLRNTVRPAEIPRRAKEIRVFFVCAALLGPHAVAAQRPEADGSCAACEIDATAPLKPGTPAARAALLEPLGRLGAPDGHRDPAPLQEASPSLGCTELALIVGALSAGAGLLLAVFIDSWLPSEPQGSDYVLAGGTMFLVGAAYAGIRCRIEGSGGGAP